MLYLGLPMCLFTGTYRLIARKQFFKQVILGFIVDILYLLAMFYMQGLNNANSLKEHITVNKLFDLSWIAFVPLILKVVCLVMWPIELFMFIAEMCRKQS